MVFHPACIPLSFLHFLYFTHTCTHARMHTHASTSIFLLSCASATSAYQKKEKKVGHSNNALVATLQRQCLRITYAIYVKAKNKFNLIIFTVNIKENNNGLPRTRKTKEKKSIPNGQYMNTNHEIPWY